MIILLLAYALVYTLALFMTLALLLRVVLTTSLGRHEKPNTLTRGVVRITDPLVRPIARRSRAPRASVWVSIILMLGIITGLGFLV